MQGSVNVQGAAQVSVTRAIETAQKALEAATASQSTGSSALNQASDNSKALEAMQEAINTAAKNAADALQIAQNTKVTVSEETITEMQNALAALKKVPEIADKAHDDAASARETADKVQKVVEAMDAVSRHYRFFEADEWKEPKQEEYGPEKTALELRVPESKHHMKCKSSVIFARGRMDAVLHKVRVCKGRNCGDFVGGEDLEYAKKAIINAEIRALKANQETPGSYPVAENGHTLLTWEQVQYFLLENVLVSAEEAAAKAEEKGFNWSDRDTVEAEESSSLERILGAAYVPALGGAHTHFDEVCTVEALRGLHLRRVRYREEDGTEIPFNDTWDFDVAVGCHPADDTHDHGVLPERAPDESEGGVLMKDWYELDGRYVEDTWITAGTEVYIEEGTHDLILESERPFAGDIMIIA